MVKTPVLFETFARPDYARRVWDAIKAAKPRSLYFYSNKARADKPDEIQRNEEVRSFVEEIDWDCDLHTWFREEYVDVYTSLKGAVDWVCENEEEWIALEEDVVPTLAFFSFCDQMIEYYRDDMRVWNVSGDNFLNINPGGYDYIFSHYHWMYGWATWRNRWQAVDWDDFRINETIKKRIFDNFFKTKTQVKQAQDLLIEIRPFLEKTKCWDYAFGLACDQHGSLAVVPCKHLVTNIGVSGVNHENDEKQLCNVESTYNERDYIINNHPPCVEPDKDYDYCIFREIYKYIYERPLWRRIILSVFDFLGIEKTFRRIQNIVRGNY